MIYHSCVQRTRQRTCLSHMFVHTIEDVRITLNFLFQSLSNSSKFLTNVSHKTGVCPFFENFHTIVVASSNVCSLGAKFLYTNLCRHMPSWLIQKGAPVEKQSLTLPNALRIHWALKSSNDQIAVQSQQLPVHAVTDTPLHVTRLFCQILWFDSVIHPRLSRPIYLRSESRTYLTLSQYISQALPTPNHLSHIINGKLLLGNANLKVAYGENCLSICKKKPISTCETILQTVSLLFISTTFGYDTVSETRQCT